MIAFPLLTSAVLVSSVAGQYTATYDPANLPDKSEAEQSGTNKCGTENSKDSMCQNVYVNSASDFCVWGPPKPNGVIGEIEQIVVSYCTAPGRGTRVMPEGTLKSAHFVKTPDYVQVTGTGDFTKIGIKAGDAGGELDPHGADKLGNPHGGLVFSNAFSAGPSGLGVQMHEWTNFQSATDFCIRACKDGPGAKQRCQHIYDLTGCQWNIPGEYGAGFTNCEGDSTIPMGLYPQPDGSTSTFRQGHGPTPDPHPAASTSMCTTLNSFAVGTATTRSFAQSTATNNPSDTGSWVTGTPTSAASATNSASGANLGRLGVALASIVVGALGAGIYLL
ncbi:carbohydrate-binding module family 13 protein [Rhizoctonia solani AG-3 Rhs1AP]|uniref:Carbohydrate-binding module family 13 protein n=2 Tax=Rhizoctonia solani AG-3 TaxID=1086053 RepID=A0A074RHF1_9AGAM|nr:carbohydrate-binding module family 13 protein [Rhizoctonia solani AG-3 Rhs1AP]KEP46189.1 carbohydrate-binding module family 13 protein [Rhizoctonia solani 123E]